MAYPYVTDQTQPFQASQQHLSYGQQPPNPYTADQPSAYSQQQSHVHQPLVQGQLHTPQPAYGAPVIAAYLPGHDAPYMQHQQIFMHGIVVDHQEIVLNRLRRGGIAFLTSGVIFIIVAIVLTASFRPSCTSGVCNYSLYYWWWFVIGGLFIGIGARNLIMARRLQQGAVAQ